MNSFPIRRITKPQITTQTRTFHIYKPAHLWWRNANNAYCLTDNVHSLTNSQFLWQIVVRQEPYLCDCALLPFRRRTICIVDLHLQDVDVVFKISNFGLLFWKKTMYFFQVEFALPFWIVPKWHGGKFKIWVGRGCYCIDDLTNKILQTFNPKNLRVKL